ncbi:hypothetical protein, partial [Xanthomonas vasicola]|uniref:hypothetical protein n=1 Tax=Xanthomonas vasicola TaxID=56459 RepID=UPI001620E055
MAVAPAMWRLCIMVLGVLVELSVLEYLNKRRIDCGIVSDKIGSLGVEQMHQFFKSGQALHIAERSELCCQLKEIHARRN